LDKNGIEVERIDSLMPAFFLEKFDMMNLRKIMVVNLNTGKINLLFLWI